MGSKLIITSSPHLKGHDTVKGIMLDVAIALLPACVASAVIFGAPAVLVLAVSTASAVLSEAVWQKALKRDITVGDCSAVITGMLLGMSLPPGVPLYIPALGSAFAIVIAKQIFGGLGCNFVNPALAGRAFLVAAWPAYMTGAWINPVSRDAATGATPLSILHDGSSGVIPATRDLFRGNRLGSVGETCILALLLGGIYLLVRGVIDFRIPLGYLGTLFAGTWIFGKPGELFKGDGLTAVLLGGAVMGAFFMATDYVTSPVTKRGRLYMGIGAGLITLLIRLWGGYPEGVTYAILLMNLVTPLIDRVVVPPYYGRLHDVEARRKARTGR